LRICIPLWFNVRPDGLPAVIISLTVARGVTPCNLT
jgi:hypothetical protein